MKKKSAPPGHRICDESTNVSHRQEADFLQTFIVKFNSQPWHKYVLKNCTAFDRANEKNSRQPRNMSRLSTV